MYTTFEKLVLFQLRTFDTGNSSLEDFVDVIINVRDVNDINPRFRQPSYNATILEDAQGGTFVIEVEVMINANRALYTVILTRQF